MRICSRSNVVCGEEIPPGLNSTKYGIVTF